MADTSRREVLMAELEKPSSSVEDLEAVVQKDPVSEVRRLRQLIRIFVDEVVDKEAMSAISPESKRKLECSLSVTEGKIAWQHESTPLMKAMKLLQHLDKPRKLNFITLSKLKRPTDTTRYIITATLMIVDDGIVSPWKQARFFLQRHPFEDRRFMRIVEDGPWTWVSKATAQKCVTKFLSKIDVSDIPRSGEGCDALFKWTAAICQLVLSQSLLDRM